MKLVWSKELYARALWEPFFSGVFSYTKSGVYFYYEDDGTVMCACDSEDTPFPVFQPHDKRKLPLPRHWMIIEQADERYLLCGEEIAIHLGINLPTIPVPAKLRTEYLRRQIPPKHFVEDSFTFGEYQVVHKGERGYACRKDGTQIWKFVGQGYLYTDIFRQADNLYFGTAGAGGGFYIIDICTGTPILSLRTGSTTVIQQRGSCSYIYTGIGKKKSRLLCVDISRGEILDEIELPGTASSYSVLGQWENYMYTVTYRYQKGCVKNAIFSCILLDE